jgi:hypothetical protein
MIKKIFILWFQGLENAPYVVQKCIESWKYYNPSWKVIILHEQNLHKYMDIHIFKHGKYKLKKLALLIQYAILQKYGGVWCNATTFCNMSLNEWLYNYINQDFFAYRRPGINKYMSTLFMYANKNSYIIQKLYEKTLLYYKMDRTLENIFHILYITDHNFHKLWESIICINIIQQGVYNKQPKTCMYKNKNIPFYKLTYNYESTYHMLFNNSQQTFPITNIYLYNQTSRVDKTLRMKYF